MTRYVDVPKWRKATWALLIWNVLIAVWIVAGVNNASNTPCDPSLSAELCDSATAIGAGIGVTFILIIWFLGFVVLGLIWLMSRPKDNVAVVGPSGQTVLVSEKEAQKRVKKEGWHYPSVTN